MAAGSALGSDAAIREAKGTQTDCKVGTMPSTAVICCCSRVKGGLAPELELAAA